MKLSTSFLYIALTFSLYSIAFLNFTVQPIFAQQQQDSKIALQRGYRTGYSDGYMAGYRDTIDNAAKNFSKHGEYEKADRAFNKDYGVLADYRDGYRQGFEAGYDTGFEKRSFDATIPVNLNKRGIAVIPVVSETNKTKTVAVEEPAPVKTIETPVVNTPTENVAVVNAPVEQPQQVSENAASETSTQTNAQLPVMTAKVDVSDEQKPSYTPVSYNETTVTIPTETELIVELIDNIDTERNREGDKFQARIVSPTEINGAIIEGRISKIQRPGRIKRRAEMLLSFDRIVLPNNRWSNFNAVVTEVLPVKGDNVKRVDTEGTVEGKSSVKDDSIKVGAATGTGLVVGAIAGGPVGAAVGATVGAAFGAGAAIVERGKDIKLNKNQQLRIKTAYETQIR